MKSNLLLLVIILTITSISCSTIYKSGQTPDDLYASPSIRIIANPQSEETAPSAATEAYRDDNYQSVINKDDNYLRMRVANRNRWDAIDDYSYWNDSRYDYNNCSPYNNYNDYYSYGGYGSYGGGYYNNYYGGYNSSGFYYTPQWNNYWGYYNYNPSGYGWGGWNSPYFSIISYQNYAPKVDYSNGSNLSAYKNKNYNNIYYSSPNQNNSNKVTITRSINTYSGNNNQQKTTTVDRPARTYTPTSSNAGGKSGGYNSSGSSSSSKPRSGRN